MLGCSRQVQVQWLVNELRLCKTPYTPVQLVTVSPQGTRLAGILLASVKLVLDASPPSGEWGVFGIGNGVTYSARGPVNCVLWPLTAGGSSGEWSPGPVFNAVSKRALVVIRLTTPCWQQSSLFSLIVGKPHLGSRLTPQRVVRLCGSRGWY